MSKEGLSDEEKQAGIRRRRKHKEEFATDWQGKLGRLSAEKLAIGNREGDDEPIEEDEQQPDDLSPHQLSRLDRAIKKVRNGIPFKDHLPKSK